MLRCRQEALWCADRLKTNDPCIPPESWHTYLQHAALCQGSAARRDKRGQVGVWWGWVRLSTCSATAPCGVGGWCTEGKETTTLNCVYVRVCVRACACERVCFLLLCKANGEAYNPVRGKGGVGCLGECLAPSSTAGWLTGHWTPFPSSHLRSPLQPPSLPPIQRRKIMGQSISEVKR